ncbi:MAG: aconitate hydratase AcnA [Acidiferrobacteraceae bacterium]|nr:aconitate hydratase AcnA [Acidiferrobacteraceae bacterium]
MNSFNTRQVLRTHDAEYTFHALDALVTTSDLNRLPYSIKILLENLLRIEGEHNVSRADIEALATWNARKKLKKEIIFNPSRVLMQDFTGVPAIVDLAAMREAIEELGGDPNKINPLAPTDLVIDHSVMVDHSGSPQVLHMNSKLEYERNIERYSFLRWGQNAFDNFRVVPPATGIVHQVNLEYLSTVISKKVVDDETWAIPDTVIGTDSHTTMINGLGVLGWGVGGIEAEAAMLGQSLTMLVPEVVGFRLQGALADDATATDLVLTIVELLRKEGVVGKIIEFFGDGLDKLSLADRSTISNMAPEYGATCGMFPIDEQTIEYLQLTNRSESQIDLVRAYSKRQNLFRGDSVAEAIYASEVMLDLSTVVPSIAGPKRPQDRIPLSVSKNQVVSDITAIKKKEVIEEASRPVTSTTFRDIEDGAVVIAAITSCTNTSNPNVMMAAGIVARNATQRGLKVKPWVKTSLAPGSQVVTSYLENAGLLTKLEAVGFSVVGYGCTTCIGNSGPLLNSVSDKIRSDQIVVSSVLSGNRNFEGRIHPDVQMNFLASPPLVVAYALAGTMAIDLEREPLGSDSKGDPVFLSDLWPTDEEVQQVISSSITKEMFQEKYSDVFVGDIRWRKIETHQSNLFNWDPDSTYVRKPPYFDGITKDPPGLLNIKNARALVMLGDSVTTDHISPAGTIRDNSPAGIYLTKLGVSNEKYNSYGARRGNHEVMIRGTFANPNLANEMVGGALGGVTCHYPSTTETTIFDAAMRYKSETVPLIVIAGKEYGAGSSRDWAAKGPSLLGVKAVLVESFERIHRQNLLGMGILPLQFISGESRKTLGLNGSELYSIIDMQVGADEVTIMLTYSDDTTMEFKVKVCLDTPMEWTYYLNGGILPYVVRRLSEET